jgi:4-methylaminobutanoate oxidase (formaldehyde-forming)
MIDAGEPIDQSWIDAGEWTVEIGAQTYPASVSLRPMYDPKNERIRT